MARLTASVQAILEPLVQEIDLQARVTLRAARAEDLPKLEWFGAYAHFRDLYQRTWRDHQAGRRLMLVADLNDFPVGQVWLDVTPNEYAYLYALRVMEPLRGLGLGTQLIETAAALARSQGYRQIQLAVEKTNDPARRLYERLGFRIFAQRTDNWSYTDQHGKVNWVREDVYIMRRAL